MRNFTIILLALVLSGTACPQGSKPEIARPTPSPSASSSRIATKPHADLRILRTLRGTKTDIIAGELALDASRNLLFISEQHEEPASVEFRVRVVNARTLETVRLIGPGVVRAVDPDQGLLFVGLLGSTRPTVTVFAIETGERLGEIPQDDGGRRLVVDPSDGRVYMLSGQTISVYSVPSLDRVDTFSLTQIWESLAIDTTGDVLFVYRDARVAALDARTGHPLRRFSIRSRSHSLIAGENWFATGGGSYEASDLDLYAGDGARIWNKHFRRGIGLGAVDHAAGLLFHTLDDLTYSEFSPPNDRPDTLEARSFLTGAELESLQLPDGPAVWAVDPSLRRLYVSCVLGNTVHVIAY